MRAMTPPHEVEVGAGVASEGEEVEVWRGGASGASDNDVDKVEVASTWR